MSDLYSVNHWCSHPDNENDDCMTGDDFATKEEALAFFKQDAKSCYIAFIEIDGPDIYQVRANPFYSARQVKLDDSLDRREAAMQAGMAFGCQGYNEAMGYD